MTRKNTTFTGLNLIFLKHSILHIVIAISDCIRNSIAFCLKNFVHFGFE